MYGSANIAFDNMLALHVFINMARSACVTNFSWSISGGIKPAYTVRLAAFVPTAVTKLKPKSALTVLVSASHPTKGLGWKGDESKGWWEESNGKKEQSERRREETRSTKQNPNSHLTTLPITNPKTGSPILTKHHPSRNQFAAATCTTVTQLLLPCAVHAAHELPRSRAARTGRRAPSSALSIPPVRKTEMMDSTETT